MRIAPEQAEKMLKELGVDSRDIKIKKDYIGTHVGVRVQGDVFLWMPILKWTEDLEKYCSDLLENVENEKHKVAHSENTRGW